MTPNYYKDENPFNLAPPPKWFLKELYVFDPSLVIVPSRQGFYYRLAQRRKLLLTEKVINEALFAQSDTKMLAAHSLVPVTTILANPNWGNPLLFEELRTRCPWRMGGAAAAIKMVEDADWKKEMDKRAATSAHIDHLTNESWLYYNKKIGTRSNAFQFKTNNAPQPTGLVVPNSPKPYKPLVTSGFSKFDFQ